MNQENKKLILPRNYLSWSALSCWLSNKTRFHKEYIENSDKLDTRYLRFGKGIAQMIESGKYKTVLPDLIVYEENEFEIRTEICGVPVLSFIDDYDRFRNVFREKKTGKRGAKGEPAWTQAKVQKHDQLTFYATALKHFVGKMPEYCDLDWIETKEGAVDVNDFWRDNEKEINVTGYVKSFHRVFDPREVARMEKLIVKVAWEISDAYVKYLRSI